MFPLAVVVFTAHVLAPPPGTEYKQPQIAVSKSLAALTFGAGNTIYCAVSRDAGRTFSEPVKVAEDGVLALGRHRGPRVAITPRAVVISAVVGRKGGGADGDLLTWRSTDWGKTWSKGATINDVPAAAREGLHAMAASPDGTLFAAWLDLRQKGTRLYGAASHDDGRTWSANRLVYESPDGHICECCHPSAVVDNLGVVYVMWRNWLGGARDLYLARSKDGGENFTRVDKLGQGTWPLNACPMDGGGLALDAGGHVITAWRREGAVFLDRPDEPEVPTGNGKDPSVAVGVDGPYVAWSGATGLMLKTPRQTDPVVLTKDGAYPVLAGQGPVMVAWESEGSIIIQSVR